MSPTPLSRRTVLRGVGTALALPWLEAMASASPPMSPVGGAPDQPLRTAVMYVPNGVHMPAWTPAAEGAEFELGSTLEPLAPLRDELLVLSGLTQDKARANGDGPGDHARACAAFLTGAQPRKTAGRDIHAGISMDQVAAAALGPRTRFRSLELGCEAGRQSGQCDSGYACVYSSQLSWRSARTPSGKETDPRQVFDRLFLSAGATPEERRRKADERRSVLDLVRGDARRLERELGATDRRKLDEYQTGVRELERRLERNDRNGSELPDGADLERPAGAPKDFGEHIRLLLDLMVLAFQTDSTRVATFLVANEGSNRGYAFLDAPEGHHDLSHHGGEVDKHEKLKRINRWHVEHLAYFLGRLAEVREEGASLLDRSMVLFGGGISDGNRHNHDELPILLAGRAGGALTPGRHLRFPRNTPLNNLYLSMLDRLGASVPALGDSTGRLEGLA